MRHPAVGDARGAALDAVALAAHPDRDRPLHRQGIEARIGDAVVRAREGHELARPQRAHHGDLLLDAPAARTEVGAERLELDGIPSDRNAEPQAAAREDIDGGRLLRDERRLALRKDDDAARKPEARGGRGEEAEQHERLVKRVAMRVRPLPAAGPLRIRAQHVIEREEVRVTHLLRRLRKSAYGSGVVADLRLREDDADVHDYAHRGAKASPLASTWQTNGAPKCVGMSRAPEPAHRSSTARRLLRAFSWSSHAKLFHSGWKIWIAWWRMSPQNIARAPREVSVMNIVPGVWPGAGSSVRCSSTTWMPATRSASPASATGCTLSL